MYRRWHARLRSGGCRSRHRDRVAGELTALDHPFERIGHGASPSTQMTNGSEAGQPSGQAVNLAKL